MTVASPIPIAELATRWYALTVENAPKLDMSLRLEVENYCSGDPWAGNPTSQAMGSILAEDQDLRDQLDSLLGTSYKAVGTAMLLMWSLTQNKNKSWPHAASARDTIARWDESDVLWTEGAPDRNRVQHVLNFTLPLAHTMALETRAEFFHSIYDKVMPFLPMLARNQAKGEEARKRADLYVALGHCALQAVALDARSAQWHEKKWIADIRELCVGNDANRQLVAATIAQSDLPDQYKLRAFKGLAAELWSSLSVKQELLACMPDEEYRRLPLLAWCEAKTEQVSPVLMDSIMGTNQDIVRDFCPKLFPLLELGCTPRDWGTQAVVSAMAETLHMGRHNPALEVYALPEEPSESP